MSAATRQLRFPPLQGAGPPTLPAHQVRSPEPDAASTPGTTKVAHARRCICSCFAVLLAAYAVAGLMALNTVKPICGIVIGAFGKVSADTHSLVKEIAAQGGRKVYALMGVDPMEAAARIKKQLIDT
eukprot:CAMPEP_0179864166 /NCGR_PEP_ID=MMETSP0982-20121206/16001_1 /TAXON_ID=483367 /ORGANISM="non described non described, Strain CCMP 2436" /LENGTH=126 /DNA_ID=CAMNT_0021752459 /DNA_START=374 /DNA_END=751 /DNA_ORIENTATION=+